MTSSIVCQSSVLVELWNVPGPILQTASRQCVRHSLPKKTSGYVFPIALKTFQLLLHQQRPQQKNSFVALSDI